MSPHHKLIWSCESLILAFIHLWRPSELVLQLHDRRMKAQEGSGFVEFKLMLAGSVKSALWPCLYFFLTRMYDFLLYMQL